MRLGARLGEGGEGVVHVVDGSGDLAAKIYLPGLAAEREGKVLAMAGARLHANKFVAYPVDALFDLRSGAFAGFTMRKAANRRPVHELYSPSNRKDNHHHFRQASTWWRPKHHAGVATGP